MSKARQRLKAQKRQAEYLKHGARKKLYPCSRCGEPGPHFVPPSMGTVGFYSCDPPAHLDATRDCMTPPGAPCTNIQDFCYRHMNEQNLS